MKIFFIGVFFLCLPWILLIASARYTGYKYTFSFAVGFLLFGYCFPFLSLAMDGIDDRIFIPGSTNLIISTPGDYSLHFESTFLGDELIEGRTEELPDGIGVRIENVNTQQVVESETRVSIIPHSYGDRNRGTVSTEFQIESPGKYSFDASGAFESDTMLLNRKDDFWENVFTFSVVTGWCVILPVLIVLLSIHFFRRLRDRVRSRGEQVDQGNQDSVSV